MELEEFASHRATVTTDHGEIAYVDVGDGSPILFVHGVFLNGYLWRHVISRMRSERRCIAVDLLGHGHTRMSDGLELSLGLQADMLASFCAELGLDRIDLVGNDSGGAIAQIFSVRDSRRIRTLTLTNCDAHDNIPPDAFKPAVQLAATRDLAPTVSLLLGDIELARSEAGFGSSYERPELLTEATVRAYLDPSFATAESGRAVERFVASADAKELLAIEADLKRLNVPTLIVWGTADVFFETRWAYWLKDNIPGATDVVEVEGGKLFFPEERPDELVDALRAHLGEAG